MNYSLSAPVIVIVIEALAEELLVPVRLAVIPPSGSTPALLAEDWPFLSRVAAMKPMRSKALRVGCYGGSRAVLGAERALARQGHKGRRAARTAPGFARSRGDGR